MARTVVPVTTIIRDGTAGEPEIAGDTTTQHSVSNTGRTVIEIRNSGTTTAHTATFATQITVDGQDVADRTASVPFGETLRFGDFPDSVYGRELHVDVDSAELMLRAFTYPR